MPDMEKIIKGLECCLGSNDCDIEPEEDCPYKGMCLCAMALHLDVLAMLKERETKWIHREDLDFKDKLGCNHFHGMCGNCGFIHDFIDDHTGQYKYCPQCGRAVKWNEID